MYNGFNVNLWDYDAYESLFSPEAEIRRHFVKNEPFTVSEYMRIMNNSNISPGYKFMAPCPKEWMK